MKWKFEFIKDKLVATFRKQTFDWDVSGLGTYVDEQSPDIMQDLINEGNLKSRINIIGAFRLQG